MKLYNLSLVAALALGGLLVCTSGASAQDSQQQNRRRGNMAPAQVVERMSTEVKLTPEQKKKVTAVLEDQSKQMSALSREERREKGRTIRQETDKKLKEILSKDQWEKWQKYRQENRQRRGNRNGGGNNAQGQ